MAALTIYTTTGAVRAALGVTDNEISDASMSAQGLDLALLADLSSWFPTHEDKFSDSLDPADDYSAPQTEIATYSYLKLYSMWFCAHTLAGMPLSFLKSTSDGKAEVKRMQVDLDAIAATAKKNMDFYKEKLQTIVKGEAVTEAAPLMAGVSPAYDPVTGT